MTQPNTYLARLADPALRGYAVAVAASLAVIFVVQFDAGTVAAAGVPVLCGVAGLLLRWTAMPVVLLLTLAYFLIFPIGLPLGLPGRSMLRDSYLRFDDLLLVAAIVVYLAAQCRLFDLTAPNATKTEQFKPERPTTSIGGIEILLMLGGALCFVLLGQALWWLETNLEIHTGSEAPLRWLPDASTKASRRVSPSTQSAELNRFLLLVFGLVITAGSLRFSVWYLRLSRLKPLEGRLILLDAAWRLNRRELARLEAWRAYRLGHHTTYRSDSSLFRWISRGIVIVMLTAFFFWILYIYQQYP